MIVNRNYGKMTSEKTNVFNSGQNGGLAMSTNPGPTTTYRHNICGSMADRHDSGPGIIRCGDVPQNNEKMILSLYRTSKAKEELLERATYLLYIEQNLSIHAAFQEITSERY